MEFTVSNCLDAWNIYLYCYFSLQTVVTFKSYIALATLKYVVIYGLTIVLKHIQVIYFRGTYV